MHSRVVVGQPVTLESMPAGGRYGVVFEDDGDTGYLYGLDLNRMDQPILDALHVYDAAESAAGRTVVLSIEWDLTYTVAALFINDVAQAVFNFVHNQARCRTGYPPADGKFCSTHDWNEEILHGLHPAP